MTSGIDGLYLMNATSDSGHKSGIAFYFDLNSAGVGRQPDSYIDIGNPGHYILWEGQTIQGMPFLPHQTPDSRSNILAPGTFPNGDTLTVNIVGDGQNKAVNEVVGSASNNEQSFQVFKSDGHELFESNGFTFTAVYYCR